MIQKPYTLQVDIKGKISYPLMEFIQGDTANYLYFNVTSGIDPLDLTNITGTVTFEKLDKTTVVGQCYIENNQLVYELGTQEIAVSGTVIATLEVYEGTNRLTSPRFQFNVQTELNDGTAIESTTEYRVLTTLIADVQNVNAVEALRVEAENQRKINEDARINAEGDETKGRIKAENDRTAAENQREINETNRVNTFEANETDRTNTFNANEVTRQSQEIIRQNQETTRQTNEVSRQNSETARQSAETNRQSTFNTNETARGTTFTTNETNRTNTFNANEATRQTNETVRQNNEALRVQKLQRITEDNILKGSYPTPTSLTTVVDSSGRVTQRTYTQNGLTTEINLRGNFDANNNPQSLIRELFDSSQKGTSKVIHILTYSILNEVTGDTATESAYDSVDMVISRPGLAINPLCAYSPTSLTAINNNVVVTDGAVSIRKLVNNLSALEIQNNKILTTFTTIATPQTIIV